MLPEDRTGMNRTALKTECVAAVAQVLGRPVSDEESRAIVRGIREGMVSAARQDPTGFRKLPLRARFHKGAEIAAKRWTREAEKQKQRLQLSLEAHDRITSYVTEQVHAGSDPNPLEAFSRLIAGKADGKNRSMSAEGWSRGIFADAMGQLVDAFSAIHPRLFGLLANRDAELQMLAALHGRVDGIRPEIVRGAKAWHEVTAALRERYNAAGGLVGKLDNWGLPHAWSQARTARVPRDTFVADYMRWVDRSKYVNEDGTLFDDNRMRDWLGAAWVDIVTNGAAQPLDPLQRTGLGVRANRHRESRQIHLKDAEAARDALDKYSGGNVAQAMQGHIRQLSRDLALIEVLGPNADYTAAHFIDHYGRQEALLDPTQTGESEKRRDRVSSIYDAVAGNVPLPPNRNLASISAGIRAWLVSSHLGSAAITALTDEGTIHLTAHVNNLPLVKVFLNEVRAFNPADRTERRLAERAGLMVHTMADSMDRFGAETLGHEVPQKLAGFIMRASGLNAMTEARRRAFSVTMLDTIGSLSRQFGRVEDLDAGDWKLLRDKGITAEDWAVWRAATPESWRGNDTVLTARAVLAAPGFDLATRQRAATRLMAATLEEQDFAIIEPGARERAFMHAGSRAGTVKGELLRSFWLFKSFPTALLMRHWKRGLGLFETTQGKAGYLGTLLATQTVLGAIALEINDVISGKDPRSLDPTTEFGGRNWVAATLKGGSLGLYGEFLFADTSSYGKDLFSTFAGPVGSLFTDVDGLTRENMLQHAAGEETDVGAEAVRMAKSYTPGRSLWYTKAALDRIVFSRLQDFFSEDYSSRAAERARRNYGTEFWWAPDEAMPGRAPNLEAIAGGEKK
jgi:hypothetical protein